MKIAIVILSDPKGGEEALGRVLLTRWPSLTRPCKSAMKLKSSSMARSRAGQRNSRTYRLNRHALAKMIPRRLCRSIPLRTLPDYLSLLLTLALPTGAYAQTTGNTAQLEWKLSGFENLVGGASSEGKGVCMRQPALSRRLSPFSTFGGRTCMRTPTNNWHKSTLQKDHNAC